MTEPMFGSGMAFDATNEVDEILDTFACNFEDEGINESITQAKKDICELVIDIVLKEIKTDLRFDDLTKFRLIQLIRKLFGQGE